MMYAQGDDFIKDFAMRTKSNLISLEKNPYEVTQLINSMIGFLIIPEQRQYKRITDNMIDDLLLQEMKQCITIYSYHNPICLQQICKHLRNAVAHSRISFEAQKSNISSEPLTINAVKFTDKNNKTNECMEIRLTIELLKKFLFAFSDAVSDLP